jgi:hypothetical protein
VRLSELLGCDFVEFPGGHLAAAEAPEEFAGRLLTVLN